MQLNLDGYTTLPAGKLANVATSLEMTAAPAGYPAPRDDIALDRVERPDLDWYLDLFRRIGEPFLWFSRRIMPRAQVAAILADPLVEVYSVRRDGGEIGLVELDRRTAGVVEIAYFGLVPEATGLGAGRAIMDRTLQLAWSSAPRKVWVHTCTLDHPGALAFYQKCGFRAFARMIEVVDDPRLTGALPREAAPWVPII